jgi:NADPH-dependent 2,4-dienoyl-CoA reductase/sulfur reductase-like enzyme
MTAPERIVVVGAGLAAATCCVTLRELGYPGSLVLVGAEPHLPYERPPLSKGLLMGQDDPESVFVRPAEWYHDQHVEVLLGSVATALDLDAHTVTADGRALGYDQLLLATGAVARRLPMADESGAPVAYLRTLDDCRRIQAALVPGARIAIIGGGWIGLEVASAARAAGCEVVIVEALEQPLGRVLGPELGAMFAGLHRDHGVDLRTATSLTSLRRAGDGSAQAVLELGDGSTVTADLVLVGVGAIPSTGLAEAAGLTVDNGIVVDEHLRTSHPDVLAVGDVANAFNPRLGHHVRVEHWDNAIEQGRAAASTLLGDARPYDHQPYFFSDQYDLGMEYVGHVGPEGHDELVVRGDLAARVCTALWVKAGRVVAGMQANDWDATESIRRLLDAGPVDVAALRDPQVPLEAVAAAPA